VPPLASRAALGLALLIAAPIHAQGQPLEPEFTAIVSATTQLNHPESIAKMQRWVDAHGGDPQAPRGLLWMAQLERSDGQSERARPLLERVLREGPGTEWALHAQRQLADLDLDRRHYAKAIATYEQLARDPAPFWQYVGKSAAQDARGQRLRFVGLLAALILLVGVALERLLRIGLQALWPMPNELAYPLPVLVVILIASFSLERAEEQAVITLSLGAVALLWINGAYLKVRPPKGLARVPQALLGLVQAIAIFYCAIQTSGLWEKLVDTWQMGAD
jgi:tetratricopeptide (TPR) repeat protein